MGAAITQLLPQVGVTPRWGGVLLPMGQARWVVTGRAGLCLCGGTARERAGVGVAPVLRGTPAITQLLHLVGVTPQLAGLVLPTGWAQWVVPARAGLCLCGSPTRERAGVWVAAGPRATPVITQLLPRGGGDPRLGGLAPPTGQARWVATGQTGLGMCSSPTRERACLGVGPGLGGTPLTTQLFHLDEGDPPLGWPGPAHRQGPASSACTHRAVPVWQPHAYVGRPRGGGGAEGHPHHNATFTCGWG